MMWNIRMINRALVAIASACVFGLFFSATWMAKSALEAVEKSTAPTLTIERVITNNVCNRA